MSLRGLAGKVAVVTGGASGIGEATVRRLVDEDCRVVIVDFDEARARELSTSLGRNTCVVAGDVAEERTAGAWLAAALDQFGRLDFVHNNAAVAGPMAPLVDVSLDGFDRVVAVNLRGVFIGTRTAMRQMRLQGQGGAIVNTAALAGVVGFRNISAYTAAKHGVVGLSKVAAAEGAPDKIRVNVVNPGFTLTPVVVNEVKAMGEGALERYAAMQPMGRGAQPAETAAAIVWLLSDEASFINGAVLAVDGAFSACQI